MTALTSNGLFEKQVKLRQIRVNIYIYYLSWGGCFGVIWIVGELDSLKITKLKPFTRLIKAGKPKVFTNGHVFFTRHYNHGPNLTDPQQTQTYNYSNTFLSVAPSNCEPQTPKASFPSPLSSSVVSPPRASRGEGTEPWRVNFLKAHELMWNLFRFSTYEYQVNISNHLNGFRNKKTLTEG